MKRKIIAIVVTLATIIAFSIVLMAVKADTNASNLLTVTNINAFDNTVGESFIQANAGITDFEIVIKKENVLNNVTVEVLYPDVKISETDEDYRVYYYQACASSEKKEIKAGTRLVSIKYKIPKNYFSTHKQYNETLKKDTATYTLPLKGSVNLKSDGKIYSDFNISNNTLYIFENKFGDVDNDGKITLKDVKILYNHLNGTSPITDEVIFKYADANGDSVVDQKDKDAIYAYVAEHTNGELSNVPLENKPYVVYGDINTDGIIDSLDLSMIINYIYRNKNGLNDQEKKIADIDNNGIINIIDRYILIDNIANNIPGDISPFSPLPTTNKYYIYGDIDFDAIVGFSDITKLIDMKYNNKSSYVWNEEIIQAMGLDSGSKPGFQEIISLISYVYEPHKIIYNLDGGTMPNDKDYPTTFRSANYEANYVVDLPKPEKSGFTFYQWSSNIDDEYERVGNTFKVISKDITYTAQWK